MQANQVVSRGGLSLIDAVSAAGVHSSLVVGWAHGKLKILFDVGIYKRGFDAREVFISHGHIDHIGAAVIHARAARAQNAIATYYVPAVCADPLERMRVAGSELDGQDIPMNIRVMHPGESVFIGPNNSFRVLAFETAHRVESQGYAVYSQNVVSRAELKTEYASLSGRELGELKKQGMSVTTEKVIEEHLDLVYTGDTTFQGLLDCPTLSCEELFAADIFIVECTYLGLNDSDVRSKAIQWEHVHLDDLVEHAEMISASLLVVTHISVRYSLGQILNLLKANLPQDLQSRTAVTLREFGSVGELTSLHAATKKMRSDRYKPGGSWSKKVVKASGSSGVRSNDHSYHRDSNKIAPAANSVKRKKNATEKEGNKVDDV